MNILEIKDLDFSYPGQDKKALEQIALEIEQGTFVLLCGASGSGKSTLLRQCKPPLTPYGEQQGTVLYKGKKINEVDPVILAKEIGFVGQNPREQIVTNKVWHELAFGLENLGLKHQEMLRRVAEVCEFFGIQHWYERETESLSGGEMQMLNLASTMVMQPEILLLDEPTAQLDPIAASDFLHMLERIHSQLGTTIILSEHHLEEAFGMVEKILVLQEGQVTLFDIAQKAAKELVENKNQLYQGLPTGVRLAAHLDTTKKQPFVPLTIGQARRWMDLFMDHKGRRGVHPMKQIQEKKNRETVLEAKHIAFGYEGASEDILKDVCFQLREGEWFTLLGGNGTGKSTLLKILCQGISQRQGTLHVLGKKVRDKSQCPLGQKNMVYLPQEPKAVFTEITVKEELAEMLPVMEEEQKEKKVADMLSFLKLQGMEKRHPYDLSGGQQQLLALGKVLLLEPKILLLDEPTKGLDPERKKDLGELLAALCQKNISIFMVSHDVEFCAQYAHRCAMLFQGRMVGTDTPTAFFSGNTFFTTAANRIARKYFPECITCEEVVAVCKE